MSLAHVNDHTALTGTRLVTHARGEQYSRPSFRVWKQFLDVVGSNRKRTKQTHSHPSDMQHLNTDILKDELLVFVQRYPTVRHMRKTSVDIYTLTYIINSSDFVFFYQQYLHSSDGRIKVFSPA